MTETTNTAPVTLQAEGYESLADVLQRAFNQAAHGKGAVRHARGEPFDAQVMQDGARRFGVGGLLFQAFKKSEESQRLPHDKAVSELLGAINYLAGAVIAMEKQIQPLNAIAEATADQLTHVDTQGRCACKMLPAGACAHGAGCNDG